MRTSLETRFSEFEKIQFQKRLNENVRKKTSYDAEMEQRFVFAFVVVITLFDIAFCAGYNCSIINVNITSSSHSATITWDTTPDCDKEGSIVVACYCN